MGIVRRSVLAVLGALSAGIERVAETDPGTQISEFVGSGPFMLQRRPALHA